MYLNYSNIEFDSFGRPEQPELMLQTLSGENIGIINGVSGLKLHIRYSEPSTMEFDVAAKNDGAPNSIYERITGHKLIYTKHYGIYVIMSPDDKADGVSETKHVEAYSLEYVLNNKRFFIEEGTYRFFNRTNPTDEDTVIGRILEAAPDWSVNYVSPSLDGMYRTFDEYDNFLLPFMYNDAKEKYHCIFVFNVYAHTIDAYAAGSIGASLPIYLDFDNLINEIDIKERSDELVTAIRPYGADGLDIRDINPTGSNWIYNLDYFITNGDIPSALADKWNTWQAGIEADRSSYECLTSLLAAWEETLLGYKASLKDHEGALETLFAQQSVTIQAYAMETTSAGKAARQAQLDALKLQINAEKSTIADIKDEIEEAEAAIDSEAPGSAKASILAIQNRLRMENYFTTAELSVLQRYFIEQDLSENSFVASDIDASIVRDYDSVTSAASVSVSGAVIRKASATVLGSAMDMYAVSGGAVSITGAYSLSGDIIRGTLETYSEDEFLMSLYLGGVSSQGYDMPTATLIIHGNYSGFTTNVSAVTSNNVTEYRGSSLSFSTDGEAWFNLSANVGDYQKYSVQHELLEHAKVTLRDISEPSYEFSVNSGNFIFAKEFSPFRERLELGGEINLRLPNGRIINPHILEFELDFEELSSFSISFSNRFKLYDEVNTLKEMLEKSYSSGRSFDASKHIYGQSSAQASSVSKFMNDALESAKNTIIAAANQSVIIDGAGIHCFSTDSNDEHIQKFQLRITNGMIAMSKDDWQTADLAIGVFKTESGYHSGVNAQVVTGKLIAGNDLIIENPGSGGVMQFKVDASGAWLNNSTFVLQNNNGGKIIIDPRYGLAAGGSNLFTVSGTTVTPSFITNGTVEFDSDGMPKNSNFYLDSRDGKAYFRGKIYAGSGVFAGELRAATGTFSGDITAATGTFKGTVQASRFLDASGNNMMSGEAGKFDADYLNLKGLNINNKFIVGQNGDVTITGGSISWGAVSESNEIDNRITAAGNAAATAQSTATAAGTAAVNAGSAATTAYNLADAIRKGTSSGGTFIDGTSIYSPHIFADEFVVTPQTQSGNAFTGGFKLLGYCSGRPYEMLHIYYYDSDGIPYNVFSSPDGAKVTWSFNLTSIYGAVDFTNATVVGLTARFG